MKTPTDKLGEEVKNELKCWISNFEDACKGHSVTGAGDYPRHPEDILLDALHSQETKAVQEERIRLAGVYGKIHKREMKDSREEMVEKVESLRIDFDEIEKTIRSNFYESKQKMKEVRIEKDWPSEKWEEWHNEWQRRKGYQLSTTRMAIHSRNKVLDQVISLLNQRPSQSEANVNSK